MSAKKAVHAKKPLTALERRRVKKKVLQHPASRHLVPSVRRLRDSKPRIVSREGALIVMGMMIERFAGVKYVSSLSVHRDDKQRQSWNVHLSCTRPMPRLAKMKRLERGVFIKVSVNGRF